MNTTLPSEEALFEPLSAEIVGLCKAALRGDRAAQAELLRRIMRPQQDRQPLIAFEGAETNQYAMAALVG
jgi:hypothetical protein